MLQNILLLAIGILLGLVVLRYMREQKIMRFTPLPLNDDDAVTGFDNAVDEIDISLPDRYKTNSFAPSFNNDLEKSGIYRL